MTTSIPEDDYERAELDRINVEPWMIEALALNPEYTGWGPGDDYMGGQGWSEPLRLATFSELFALDDLNECVNFYFRATRDSEECESCGGEGYNPETRKISDDFYDFAGTGRRWNDRITEDEAAALVASHRGHGKQTAAEFNAENRSPGRGFAGHDAINRGILIETRAKRLGVWGMCPTCDGHGHVYTAPAGRLSLTLWILHPRKGASRGIEIATITRDDFRAAINWLGAAARRNADRFAKVSALATPPA